MAALACASSDGPRRPVMPLVTPALGMVWTRRTRMAPRAVAAVDSAECIWPYVKTPATSYNLQLAAFTHLHPRSYLLVFDLGGGTFDVSIMEADISRFPRFASSYQQLFNCAAPQSGHRLEMGYVRHAFACICSNEPSASKVKS